MKKLKALVLVLGVAVLGFGQSAFAVSSWTPVGDPNFSDTDTDATQIVLDSNSVPYVAFRDNGSDFKITVMKFNGASWESLGIAGYVDNRYPISLALDGQNVPYVAYRDVEQEGRATVKKYDGTTWQSVGSAGLSLDTVESI